MTIDKTLGWRGGGWRGGEEICESGIRIKEARRDLLCSQHNSWLCVVATLSYKVDLCGRTLFKL